MVKLTTIVRSNQHINLMREFFQTLGIDIAQHNDRNTVYNTVTNDTETQHRFLRDRQSDEKSPQIETRIEYDTDTEFLRAFKTVSQRFPDSVKAKPDLGARFKTASLIAPNNMPVQLLSVEFLNDDHAP